MRSKAAVDVKPFDAPRFTVPASPFPHPASFIRSPATTGKAPIRVRAAYAEVGGPGFRYPLHCPTSSPQQGAIRAVVGTCPTFYICGRTGVIAPRVAIWAL